jgi:hypothetical protein
MGKENRGDPEGRRLAQQRAALLSEAGRVALVLEALLVRANYDTEVCKKLVKDLAKSEELELHRGYGRIESRKRFKKKAREHLFWKEDRGIYSTSTRAANRFLSPSRFSIPPSLH